MKSPLLSLIECQAAALQPLQQLKLYTALRALLEVERTGALDLNLTDAMLDAGVAAWFGVTKVEAEKNFIRSRMRAAVEAVLQSASPCGNLCLPDSRLGFFPEAGCPVHDERPATLSRAATDVLAERHRQVAAEGWSPEHDASHVNDEIAAMACFYVMPPGAREWSAKDTGYGDTFGQAIVPEGWAPKEGDRRRELVKAAALTLAEIERMDRAESRESAGA